MCEFVCVCAYVCIYGLVHVRTCVCAQGQAVSSLECSHDSMTTKESKPICPQATATSCRTSEWVMSHIWMGTVTRQGPMQMVALERIPVTSNGKVMSHIWGGGESGWWNQWVSGWMRVGVSKLSLTHSLAHSPTHSLTHPLTRSLTHSLAHSL